MMNKEIVKDGQIKMSQNFANLTEIALRVILLAALSGATVLIWGLVGTMLRNALG